MELGTLPTPSCCVPSRVLYCTLSLEHSRQRSRPHRSTGPHYTEEGGNLGWTGSSVPFLKLPLRLFQPGNEAGAPYLSACCVPPRVALKEKGRGPLSFPFLLVILDLLPAHSQWAGPLSAPVSSRRALAIFLSSRGPVSPLRLGHRLGSGAEPP